MLDGYAVSVLGALPGSPEYEEASRLLDARNPNEVGVSKHSALRAFVLRAV